MRAVHRPEQGDSRRTRSRVKRGRDEKIKDSYRRQDNRRLGRGVKEEC